MGVFSLKTKSSAVSVWTLPGLAGLERVAIFPSGLPVEKMKELADAGAASRSEALKAAARRRGWLAMRLSWFFMLRPFIGLSCYWHRLNRSPSPTQGAGKGCKVLRTGCRHPLA